MVLIQSAAHTAFGRRWRSWMMYFTIGAPPLEIGASQLTVVDGTVTTTLMPIGAVGATTAALAGPAVTAPAMDTIADTARIRTENVVAIAGIRLRFRAFEQELAEQELVGAENPKPVGPTIEPARGRYRRRRSASNAWPPQRSDREATPRISLTP